MIFGYLLYQPLQNLLLLLLGIVEPYLCVCGDTPPHLCSLDLFWRWFVWKEYKEKRYVVLVWVLYCVSYHLRGNGVKSVMCVLCCAFGIPLHTPHFFHQFLNIYSINLTTQHSHYHFLFLGIHIAYAICIFFILVLYNAWIWCFVY